MNETKHNHVCIIGLCIKTSCNKHIYKLKSYSSQHLSHILNLVLLDVNVTEC